VLYGPLSCNSIPGTFQFHITDSIITLLIKLWRGKLKLIKVSLITCTKLRATIDLTSYKPINFSRSLYTHLKVTTVYRYINCSQKCSRRLSSHLLLILHISASINHNKLLKAICNLPLDLDCHYIAWSIHSEPYGSCSLHMSSLSTLDTTKMMSMVIFAIYWQFCH